MTLTRPLRRIAITLATMVVCSSPVLAQEKTMRFEVPDTVSPEAKTALTQLYAMLSKFGGVFKTEPVDTAEWDRRNALIMNALGPMSKAIVGRLKVSVGDDTLGGVPVVRITPPGYTPHNRVLLYTHGGGYVAFNAHTALGTPALMAVATGAQVVSVDYTLAPHSQWRNTTDQVVAVYRALLTEYRPSEIGMFGDSAGGGLIAGTALKIRDEGLPLPGALYLMSPWFDLTDTGDSFLSLATADPALEKTSMGWYAKAYAPVAEQKQPYASPVYGDYSKPFPPTLIQGGTREILLSDFVRGYQAIRGGGHEAVLDLYEGMPHVFQNALPDIPESQIALRRAAAFFDQHLAPLKRTAAK